MPIKDIDVTTISQITQSCAGLALLYFLLALAVSRIPISETTPEPVVSFIKVVLIPFSFTVSLWNTALKLKKRIGQTFKDRQKADLDNEDASYVEDEFNSKHWKETIKNPRKIFSQAIVNECSLHCDTQ